jgi:hypothetical protein
MKESIYNKLKKDAELRAQKYVDKTAFCKTEFLEKNKEYGQTWLAYRIKSQIVRIWNKAFRVRSIQDQKEQRIQDSIVSEFDAIYNYCIIALIVIDRMNDSADTGAIQLDPKHEELDSPYETARTKCYELFKKKDHDYNGAWVTMEISAIVDEILVKLMRAASINKADMLTADKQTKLTEIFMDVANYAIFAVILIKDVGIDPME